MQISVRQYRKQDKDAILAITERSFDGVCIAQNTEREFGMVGNADWRERKKRGIEHDLDYRPSDSFVALAGDSVVGYVCTRLYRQQQIGHVANMAVKVEYQGRGVGESLLKAAINHFRDNGMQHARIETLEQNKRAANFYSSWGFREVGRQIHYFKEL